MPQTYNKYNKFGEISDPAEINRKAQENYNLAVAIANEISLRSKNLCPTRQSWLEIGFALASFGEAGRPLYHRIASIDPSYRERDTEYQFTNALRTRPTDPMAPKYTIATLIRIAKGAGIEVDRLRQEIKSGQVELLPYTPKPSEMPANGTKAGRYDVIPFGRIKASERQANRLTGYLCKLYDPAEVDRVAKLYHIAGTAEGRTIYPLIDTAGDCRTGKVISYGTDGHRIKTGRAQGATWLHYLTGQGKTYRLQCVPFGTHLLKDCNPATIVGVVEAEKSAVICTLEMPEIIWLATGGATNLPATLNMIRQSAPANPVILYPDADQRQEWTEALHRWQSRNPQAGKGVTIDCNLWAEEPAGSKRDLADLFLEWRRLKQQANPVILQLMQGSPAIALLASKVDLELVAVMDIPEGGDPYPATCATPVKRWKYPNSWTPNLCAKI